MIESWKSSGISEENNENIPKSDSNFAPDFVDHHILADMSFNVYCLIKNNFSIHKKTNKSIYFLNTSSSTEKFKRRFYIR